MKSLFNNLKWSYKNKVRFIIYMCVAIPTVILCFVIGLFVYNGYKNDIDLIKNEFAKMQKNEINNYMNGVSDKIAYLVVYDELNNVLTNNKNSSFENYYSDIKRLSNSLDAVFMDYESGQLEIYTSNKNIYKSKYINQIDEAAEERFSEILEEEKVYTVFSEKDNEVYFDMIRKNDFFDKNYSIIKVSVNADRLFGNSDYKKENFTVIGNNTDGRVFVLGTDRKEEAKTVFENYTEGKNDDYSVVSSQDIFSEYTVYNFINTKDLKDKTIKTIALYVFLLVFAGFFIIISVNKMVDSLTGRLTQIVTDILSSDTSLAILGSKKPYDEFDVIQCKLDDFKKRLMSENKKIVELELEQLGNRVSPHFLYNILSAVKCKTEDREILTTIEYLVEYYREAFHYSDAFITVQKEIANAELYVRLLQYAYGRDFLFEVAVEDVKPDYLFLSNIIQPIIENAFIHGINYREDIYGEILLKIFTENGNIVIEVLDNAQTADFDKIDEILNDTENLNSALNVINKRVKLYYGEKYGITYFEKHGYTTAHLEMPDIFTEESL